MRDLPWGRRRKKKKKKKKKKEGNHKYLWTFHDTFHPLDHIHKLDRIQNISRVPYCTLSRGRREGCCCLHGIVNHINANKVIHTCVSFHTSVIFKVIFTGRKWSKTSAWFIITLRAWITGYLIRCWSEFVISYPQWWFTPYLYLWTCYHKSCFLDHKYSKERLSNTIVANHHSWSRDHK